MARDLKINVDGNSEGGQKALEEAAAAAALAAKEANHLGDEFKKAERDAASLDKRLVETTAAAKALAIELAKNPADKTIKTQLDAQRKAATELKRLRQDIIGDTEKAAKDAADVAKRTASEFGKLSEKAAKDAETAAAKAAKGAEKAAAAAKKEWDDLVKKATGAEGSIGELFAGGPLGLLTTGPGAIVGGAAAVVGGAAVGGAATAAAGAGVAGLGVLGAVQGDPAAFAAAWAGVTGKLKAEFLDATAVFDGPGLAAVHGIGEEIAKWDLKGLFAAAVPYVEPLIHGAEGFADKLVSGIEILTKNAGPAIDVLAKQLPQIGDSINVAFAAIASQSQGGADGLEALLKAVSDVILVVGGLIAGLEALTGALKEGTGAARDFADSLPHWAEASPALFGYKTLLDHTADSNHKVQTSAGELGHSLSDLAASNFGAADAAARHAAAMQALDAQLGITTVSAKGLVDGVDQIFGALQSADHATLNWHKSMTSLADSFKANGKSIDENTTKGQANVEAVLSALDANAKLYESNLMQGKGVDFATSAYDKNEKALEKTLATAGLNQQAIDGLVGKYRSVPDKVKTDIQMEGLTNAINDLDDVLRRINGLPVRKTFTLQVQVSGELGLAERLVGASIVGGAAPKHKASGGIRHAATGLIVGPSDPGTLIGEPQTGGEALIPLRGIAPQRAAGLARTALAGYGYDVVPRIPQGLFSGGGSGGGAARTPQITFPQGLGGMEAFFASWFMKLVRTGAVQVS